MEEQLRLLKQELNSRLDLLDERLISLSDSFMRFQLGTTEKVSKLEVKSSIWGFLGGAAIIIIGLGVWALKG